MSKMCVTQKCRIWPSEKNSSIIEENLTHLAEDWCMDYSSINIWSGPCCGFYVTSVCAAVPMAVVSTQGASAASGTQEFLTGRLHLSVVLHCGIQQCLLPSIGNRIFLQKLWRYNNVFTGGQIMYFLCLVPSDASYPNKRLLPRRVAQPFLGGEFTAAFAVCAHCSLSVRLDLARAALGSSRAVEVSVSPTATSNTFFHPSYMA